MQAYNGVWQWRPRAPVGFWDRASSQTLDKQRAVIGCMGVIAVNIFTTMYGCRCLWVAFLIWTTTQLSFIASVMSEKNETTLLSLFYRVPHRRAFC